MAATLHDTTADAVVGQITRPADPTTRWAGLLRWAGDLAALAPIVVVLLVLADADGGRGLAAGLQLGVACLVALPAVAGELRRWPRVATGLLATWLVALVVGAAFATYRADMALPLLQYAMAPVLVLAASRLWPRPWMPAVLLLLLVLAYGLHQERAWSVWWVTSEGSAPQWAPLSWHNQSAALTGMFGVWFLGAALASSRLVRGGLAVLAASGLAGTWLSGSRGGVLVTVAAAVIAAMIGARSSRRRGEAWRRPVAVLVAVGALTVLLVAGLASMQPDGNNQPIANRGLSAAQTGLARIDHTQAALGMWWDRPLTGQGPGSYATLARVWNDPTGNLTSSAHNEYAEVAGELGVLGLVALLGVLVGAAVMGLRVLRTPPVARDPGDLRGPMLIGGVASAGLLLAHSGMDFDWYYPVLTSLAAIAIGMLLADVGGTRRPGRGTARATAAGLAAVLAATVGLGAVHLQADGPLPWDDDAWTARARAALVDGRPADALAATRTTLAWNPASYVSRGIADRARFALDGDAERLVAAVRSRPSWFTGRADAALDLAHAGEVAAATNLLAELHADLDRHAAWGVASTRLRAVEADVAVAAAASCDTAREVVTTALAARLAGPEADEVAREVLADRLASEGCPA